MLSHRMKDITHVGLVAEKQKMKRQFYFFGFAYMLKCIDFGVEIYFW